MSIFPEEYPGLNRLYIHTKSTGLIEIGSSSIDPALSASCLEIRTLMKQRCFLGQVGETLNDAWAAVGDTSGILYFGGREIGGHRITASEHLEYLAVVFGELSEKAASDVDKIATSLVNVSHALPVGPVYCFSKHGAFIIPPEAYKLHMTDEEKEPFRVERDDPRLLHF